MTRILVLALWFFPSFAVAEAADEARILLQGFRAYHSVCNHCHGPDGLGSSFGPALVEMVPDPDAFMIAVRDGAKGSSGVMKGFDGNPNAMDRADAILADIIARADGRLGRGRPGR